MYEIVQKIKQFTTPEMTTVAIIILIGFASFGLGRLSALESLRERVRIVDWQFGQAAEVARSTSDISDAPARSSSHPQYSEPSFQRGGQVVGSKNGIKYHFPWCAGAQRIKEENKRWFDSIAIARAAGYSAAGNCKGLE